MTFSLYGRFRQLEKVRVDKDALEGYLGAASDDGVLRTGSNLSYTDGGNYVTLDIPSTATPTLAGLSLTGELDITMATTLLVDLNPGFTGTGTVMDITPSAALSTIGSEWSGIYMNGAALNPGAANIQIHGLHLDFSGLSITNTPHIDAIYVKTPSCLPGIHAIHSDGEVHINIDASAAVDGQFYTATDVVVATNSTTGGTVHGYDVARSGTGATEIVGLATHENVEVIHQYIGTFTNADKIWEYDNDAPGWTDVTTGSATIWDDKDDLLYIGHASTFSEIKFIYTTKATKDMHFKYYFSAGSSVFTEFNPADDTNGATQNGSVRYTASSLSTWATDTVNSVASKYWIKIERTRTSGTGPTKSSIQQLAPTKYSWDKSGEVTVAELTSTDVVSSGENFVLAQQVFN